jgi:hypothetical protein
MAVGTGSRITFSTDLKEMSQDMVVSIATSPRSGQPRNSGPIPAWSSKFFMLRVQTCSGNQRASYSPWAKRPQHEAYY